MVFLPSSHSQSGKVQDFRYRTLKTKSNRLLPTIKNLSGFIFYPGGHSPNPTLSLYGFWDTILISTVTTLFNGIPQILFGSPSDFVHGLEGLIPVR